jgi:hypothetical protein
VTPRRKQEIVGMCRQDIVGLGTLLLLVVLAGPALAQQSSPPQIEQVHVGLPAGSGDKESGRVRPGAWAPVYLKIKAAKTGNVRDEFRVLIQATDAEDALYTYPVPLPALAPNQDHIAIGYVRPSMNPGEIKVFLQHSLPDGTGQTIQTFPRAVRDSGRETVAPTALLVLAVGSRLTGLKTALDLHHKPAGQAQNNPLPNKENPQLPELPADDHEDEGARRFAFIETVDRLPDQWFGYEAADVVVLTSGRVSFLKDLLEDTTHRRGALLEWVRRGGNLVLSVERNHAEVSRLLEKMPLLDVTLKGSLPLPRQGNLQSWLKVDDTLRKLGKSVDVLPGLQTHVIIRDSERPLLLQGSCGLGRVMLVGFDLDQSPFSDVTEAHRGSFWDKLLSEILQRQVKNFSGSPIQNRGDLQTDLQRGLETFDVPVIHFGWVTLFILVYILIVGPLDYFVLKKVFKRLELTWITFPTLVILISVLAYAIAYKTKGEGLRINKIDLVEYDLFGAQAYGRSWFSIFSPRIQKYTLGQEPAYPAWSAAPPADGPPGAETMLATLAIPTDFQRVGSRSLFPQPYAYAEKAEGVRGVPIPVWAMRTFTTSWHTPLDPDKHAVAANVVRSRLEAHLPTGTITNNLPVALEGITLFYNGHWYSFDNQVGGDQDRSRRDSLAPGQEQRIDHLFGADARGRPRSDWMIPAGKGQTQADASNRLIRAVLFHPEMDNERDNSGLRLLDQTWRVKPQLEAPAQQKFRPEIILVARTALASGRADDLNKGGSTPTRLWLGELPGKAANQATPPRLDGQMTQETYIRVYIPIKP